MGHARCVAEPESGTMMRPDSRWDGPNFVHADVAELPSGDGMYDARRAMREEYGAVVSAYIAARHEQEWRIPFCALSFRDLWRVGRSIAVQTRRMLWAPMVERAILDERRWDYNAGWRQTPAHKQHRKLREMDRPQDAAEDFLIMPSIRRAPY